MTDHPYEDGRADRHRPRNWRTLPRELVGSKDVDALLETVQHYGWLPPAIGVLLHGVVRGLFEHLTHPVVLLEGYWFPGWPGALVVNLVFGTAIVLFAYFMYFGVIGAIAGTFSTERAMHADIFKVAGYLSVVWLPVFTVGSAIALTLGTPAGLETTEAPMGFAAGPVATVHDTIQLRIVGVLKGVAWTVCGFVLLPVVQALYDIEPRESLAAVLPVTVAAIVAAQLV